LIINCTHEHIIRLLPAFVISRADVDEFLTKFGKVLQTVSKASRSAAVSEKTKTETQTQTITLAASR
jgi:hypothetical protein